MMERNSKVNSEVEKWLNKEIIIKYKDVLSVDLSKIELPELLEGWTSQKPQTQEYKDLVEELGVIAKYIALRISTGPEVKDSITKRCATLSVILSAIVENTLIDGFHAYGVLSEVEKNLYMDISGKHKTINLLRMISIWNQEKIKQKMGNAVV